MLDQDFLYNQVCLFQKTVSSVKFNLKTKLNSHTFRNDTLEKNYSLSVLFPFDYIKVNFVSMKNMRFLIER